MRDLALHILDIMENSIRAGASMICVMISQDPIRDILEIVIEDNGCGIRDPLERITDPFYTTKPGKKTGLGLSLFKAAAERSDGSFHIQNSPDSGLKIQAVFRLSHVDRNPLGDLAATMSSIVCTNPEIIILCRLCSGGQEIQISTLDSSIKSTGFNQGLAVARRMSERIKSSLEKLHFVA